MTDQQHPCSGDASGRPASPAAISGRIALLTRHGKGALVEAPLAALGLDVRVTDAFDTDQLGTFSGEVARTLSPLDCARRKAQLACELTGLDLGLGSEGSFGGGPMAGFMNWDEELLLLWDRRSGREIVARAAGPVRVAAFIWESEPQLLTQLAPFPSAQGWIIRHPAGVSKGLCGAAAVLAELRTNVLPRSSADDTDPVRIEPDLRAMHCPERQAYIRQAAEQLAERLQTTCPHCAAPDFWPDRFEPGLPCADCDAPTALSLAAIRCCSACGHEEREPVAEKFAEPQYCSWCNP
ncbi:MAG: hypothetical protein NXH81_02475 [Halieaceae bacterium]|uniref:DUF6671 family protein n=1 Tax=Haliea alexandrii TaxID=2448162 RepID=UPI000F0B33DE|nr:DUF6671 family protein [Haliea alexandrii]MCR9184244.1 hypothetical protein [Halieaceae bacterium]